MTDLDNLILKTAQTGGDGLDHLEAAVWARVSRLEAKARDRRLHLAALCAAAGVGGLTGGLAGETAPARPAAHGELAVFSTRIAAAPLDVRSLVG